MTLVFWLRDIVKRGTPPGMDTLYDRSTQRTALQGEHLRLLDADKWEKTSFRSVSLTPLLNAVSEADSPIRREVALMHVHAPTSLVESECEGGNDHHFGNLCIRKRHTQDIVTPYNLSIHLSHLVLAKVGEDPFTLRAPSSPTMFSLDLPNSKLW